MKIPGLRETDFVPVSLTDEEKKVLHLATLQIALEGQFVQIDRQQVADKMGYGNKASANTAIWTMRHNLVRRAGMSPGGQPPDVTLDDHGRIIIRVHESTHPAPTDAKYSASEVNATPSCTRLLRKRKTEFYLHEEVESSPDIFFRSTKSQATPSAKQRNDKDSVEEQQQSMTARSSRALQTPATSLARFSLTQAQRNMGEALAAFLAKEAVEGEHYDLR